MLSINVARAIIVAGIVAFEMSSRVPWKRKCTRAAPAHPDWPESLSHDLDSGFGSHLLRVLANPVAERLSELRIVEDPDLPLVDDVIPSAKQIFGNVPKISIWSQQPNTPAISPACRSVISSAPTQAS
jgi:hypothetical protein